MTCGPVDCRRYASDKYSQHTGSACAKHQTRNGRLTPGLFVVFCLDCGRCVGFSVMRHAESPRTPFEVFFTRWQKAPDVVVYDNACNAQQFVLNREPAFFAGTKWLVDGLHWPNHTRCPVSHSMKAYVDLSAKNSQRAEQHVSSSPVLAAFVLANNQGKCTTMLTGPGPCMQNSLTADVKTQTAFMRQSNFIFFIRYFFHRLSLRTLGW
jgi:hypothetical protein